MPEIASSPAEPAGTPGVDARTQPSLEPLYTPKQIAFASLVATPIAGALLASANLRALGRKGARVVVLASAVVVAGIFGIDVWGAGPFSFLALPVSALVALLLATAAFTRALPTSEEQPVRGVLASIAAVWVGIGVVGGAVVGALELRAPTVDEALADAVQWSPRERVEFSDDARRADAEEVARALAAAGYFTGRGSLRVGVVRDDTELHVRVIVPNDVSLEDLDATRQMLKRTARHLEPARCIQGDVVTPRGDERASGRVCP